MENPITPTNPVTPQPAPVPPVAPPAPAIPPAPAVPQPVAPAPAQPAAPAPAQPVAPPPVQPAATSKKSSPWPWITCGCLAIVIIICLTVFLLGWWGIRQAKNAINEQTSKFDPAIENINKNMDKFSQEGEEWQKKSEEMRNSLPSEEDLSNLSNAPTKK